MNSTTIFWLLFIHLKVKRDASYLNEKYRSYYEWKKTIQKSLNCDSYKPLNF